MHFHEFEHISGVIAKVFKEKKKVIEGRIQNMEKNLLECMK